MTQVVRSFCTQLRSFVRMLMYAVERTLVVRSFVWCLVRRFRSFVRMLIYAVERTQVVRSLVWCFVRRLRIFCTHANVRS